MDSRHEPQVDELPPVTVSNSPPESFQVASHTRRTRARTPVTRGPLLFTHVVLDPVVYSARRSRSRNNDDDHPPPLASDSDSDSEIEAEHDHGAQSDTGSMPSLQTVSDSSNDEVDDYDSESEGSGWDEPEARDGPQRAMETVGDTAEGTTMYASPYGSDDAWGDDELLDDDFVSYAIQGFDDSLRPIDLVDWLMSPRRLTADNDPKRAETLLEGLEAVPDELVHRYEKLRGSDGEGNEGCAICRDEYLLHDSRDTADLSKLKGTELMCALFEMLPFHPSPYQILAFPCAGRHLFHRSCLAPWLARKTTCPSCRFDIDPDSLTLRLTGPVSRFHEGRTGTQPARKWEPPRVPSLKEWLTLEERYRIDGRRATPAAAAPVGHTDRFVSFADDELEEDDNEYWTDTDEASDSEEASSRALPAHSLRRLAALLGTGAPPRGTAMNLHDTVLEDVFTRALRLGRSNFTGPPNPLPSMPPLVFPLQREPTGLSDDDDELPPLVD